MVCVILIKIIEDSLLQFGDMALYSSKAVCSFLEIIMALTRLQSEANYLKSLAMVFVCMSVSPTGLRDRNWLLSLVDESC